MILVNKVPKIPSFSICHMFLLYLVRSFKTAIADYAKPKSTSTSSYHIRYAKFDDIPAINRCNMENLPENYSDYFYRHHLTLWPELSLICENEQKCLVAYTLGKIEDVPDLFDSSQTLGIQTQNNNEHKTFLSLSSHHQSTSNNQNTKIHHQGNKKYGHITSLAVSSNYRGKGIAFALMSTLHEQFTNNFNVEDISLHCRVTNEAAIKLYVNTLRYKRVDVIKGYYEDGCDAWLMKLKNPNRVTPESSTNNAQAVGSERTGGVGFLASIPSNAQHQNKQQRLHTLSQPSHGFFNLFNFQKYKINEKKADENLVDCDNVVYSLNGDVVLKSKTKAVYGNKTLLPAQ